MNLLLLKRLPSVIGYIVAGTILGPSGLNMLSGLVQLFTIGELGVFLVLFTLGLEVKDPLLLHSRVDLEPSFQLMRYQ